MGILVPHQALFFKVKRTASDKTTNNSKTILHLNIHIFTNCYFQKTEEYINKIRLKPTYFPFSADIYSSHVIVFWGGGVRDCLRIGCQKIKKKERKRDRQRETETERDIEKRIQREGRRKNAYF